MKEKREFEPNPKTPLDDWDETIDPAIMSGDHWVEEENKPLAHSGLHVESEDCEVVEEKMTPPRSMFQHPSINVSYGNDSLTGTAPDLENVKRKKEK
ncbi:DUF3905 domain-containing protein [Alkalihalobacillus sp. LMS39]|uniref:DUF3905 domain-containing protein n=1 Tax=Alkalihalobacillus sp. LMS39 TaxID=2924032 RepID=UPI001FB462BB|nr:DUF3905 domain-containing protein [Alkalihalobacillus sp. LMS39]UOE92855.1 DUF3905 domain-containing protein [Alkalihalobacillus sp. LMS39]